MRLSERIAKLEQGTRKDTIEIIIIEGGLPDGIPYDRASASATTGAGQDWVREDGETVEAFKARVRNEIATGTRFLIYGGLPE